MSGPEGVVHPVVQVGHPVLRERARVVTELDASLAQLVADMFATMYDADGVGLAANQIGRRESVFVYDCDDDEGVHQRGVVVNPVLELPPPGERVLDDDLEGCLSVVGEHATLARPDRATVRGVDTSGIPVVVEGTGLLARCLQHECDHLEGQLYIDRLSAGERRRVLRAHALTLAEPDA